ncbi:MAG: histidine phosphatase family protein [Candidatus Peribacteria bacterium]|nr:MAG: histidine phosphatase family protein [Candidatus Peribacteria bacterium]
MKTLYIIRHAKSAFKGAGMEDFIRPLAERGEKNAKELGKILKRKEIIPDHIISSPAVRALQTCYAVCAKMKYGKEIQYER